MIFDHFWGSIRAILAHFCAMFTVIFFGWYFGELTVVLSKIMQVKAKTCKFPPKFPKIMHNCAKACPFSSIKHLFCFFFLKKKRSKSMFQPMKVCTKWVCLKVCRMDSECFYALLWRSIGNRAQNLIAISGLCFCLHRPRFDFRQWQFVLLNSQCFHPRAPSLRRELVFARLVFRSQET